MALTLIAAFWVVVVPCVVLGAIGVLRLVLSMRMREAHGWTESCTAYRQTRSLLAPEDRRRRRRFMPTGS